MKKSRMLTLCFIIFFIYGCNTTTNEKQNTEEANREITQEDTEAVNNQHANERIEVKDNGEEEISALTQYTNFELNVQYANDISFEVGYVNDEKGITAEISDEVNDVHLSGEDAKNSLIKNFEELNFDENTDESEIIIQILTTFNLSDDFTNLYLKVKYHTGTVKEYKLTN
ncbi:YusW family protein [Ureibacillus manganicus]|uniref:YusW-like protein n=1 Tax=Ureibacillus manganicus DSM 26584 TaxID=1384049 RepID=A0A0A3HTU6_9BACL|nr:YusW family protein [Ureibacillus manganicus]KGR76016.1 hypothetical protein CD29_17270 [Ureibacillus manganicus DSM 26584]